MVFVAVAVVRGGEVVVGSIVSEIGQTQRCIDTRTTVIIIVQLLHFPDDFNCLGLYTAVETGIVLIFLFLNWRQEQGIRATGLGGNVI